MSDQTTPPPDEEIRPDDALDSDDAAVVDALSAPDVEENLLADTDLASDADLDAEIEDTVAALDSDVVDSDPDADAATGDEAEGLTDEEGDALEDEYDDEYADDEDELAGSDVPESAFDWTALASAGEGVGHIEVPDLTAGGASAMDVDIDAALAAVDTLGAVVAAEQERKREEADRREAQRRADEEYRRWSESYVFRRPGMIRVQGGRVVTILPAVALMAIGAVLTLATASGQPMPWQTLFAAASAGVSVSLLSYWLASGRWARGALFAALAVAIVGVWIFVDAMPDVELTWRLPIIALGAAFAITGLLGRPRSLIWLFAGLGITVGAAALPYLSQPTLQRFGPFILAAAVVLALLPPLFRTRRG
jgi:hypothetical protein